MSDFEKYIGAKYPNRSPKILFQKFKDIDGDLFYGVKEIEDQAEVWNHQQAIINVLKAQLECCRKENAVLLGKVGEGEKRIDKYIKLTISIRNEFDLWSDDSEFAGVIEAQIENLEALRGANDSFTKARQKAEDQINNGARLTKHQIDLRGEHD
jgi:hypothetical protein